MNRSKLETLAQTKLVTQDQGLKIGQWTLQIVILICEKRQLAFQWNERFLEKTSKRLKVQSTREKFTKAAQMM